MSLFLDLIMLAIFLLFILIYAKKGFVKSIFSIAGFVASIILAFYFSAPLSNLAYTKIIEPGILTSIEKVVSESGTSLENISNNIWEALPSFVRNNADELNINPENFVNSESLQEGSRTLAQNVSDTIIRPITVQFLKIIFSLIIFVVLSVVFKFVVKFLNKVFSFSIIGKLNSLLGAVLGVIMGIVFALIFVLLVNFIISVSGGFLFFTNEAVDSSKIFRFFTEITPVKF